MLWDSLDLCHIGVRDSSSQALTAEYHWGGDRASALKGRSSFIPPFIRPREQIWE